MPSVLAPERDTVADVARQFTGGRGYLAACTTGLVSRGTRAAIMADLDATASGRPDPVAYTSAAERSRASFAVLVGVEASRVAIGAQTSVFAGMLAAAVPEGAEVLCAHGDFASLVAPFAHTGRDVALRAVPLARLADEVGDKTAVVVFSLVQSATGEVADAAAIVAAARRHGARTVCDATQAVGWMPVHAGDYDALICHAYKWLCAPRGVAFLALCPDYAAQLSPVFAGWYAGRDPWSSCYGHDVDLALDARRFDVSPAWQAFVGAEPVLAMFAGVDPEALLAHTTLLARAFQSRLALAGLDRPSAIVTWRDESGADLARLTAAGITASGRAGRARVGFHVFNDLEDVDLAARALGR